MFNRICWAHKLGLQQADVTVGPAFQVGTSTHASPCDGTKFRNEAGDHISQMDSMVEHSSREHNNIQVQRVR
jgi:hypothetical protein